MRRKEPKYCSGLLIFPEETFGDGGGREGGGLEDNKKIKKFRTKKSKLMGTFSFRMLFIDSIPVLLFLFERLKCLGTRTMTR